MDFLNLGGLDSSEPSELCWEHRTIYHHRVAQFSADLAWCGRYALSCFQGFGYSTIDARTQSSILLLGGGGG